MTADTCTEDLEYGRGKPAAVKGEMSAEEKLRILADAAKYDVACTSSGVERRGKKGSLENARSSGICHSFSADGRCISLLKILMTNHCVYDCKYCINRRSNDVVRTAFSPREICELTVEFYKRNYIEGLFLSSGVMKSPEYTMERICETLLLLRTQYHFNGYIHVKIIPGAPEELLTMAGYLADRVSINLELPTEESLHRLAPHKSFQNILLPMGKVSSTIAEQQLAIGGNTSYAPATRRGGTLADPRGGVPGRSFAPAGQSTQMIIGASDENDYQLLRTTQKLYRQYQLKRVFFSAYIPLNEDKELPDLLTPVPLLREHRLYQADWLLRFYGFSAEELLSADRPDFNPQLDPKCDWALRHLEQFPVEVETAPMEVLLRVPGIGPKSARRIRSAQAYGSLSFETLKKMGVVLKRAHYFITCGGRMMYRIPLEEEFITRQLVSLNRKENWQLEEREGQRQMSLFDDFHLE